MVGRFLLIVVNGNRVDGLMELNHNHAQVRHHFLVFFALLLLPSLAVCACVCVPLSHTHTFHQRGHASEALTNKQSKQR